MNYTFQMFAMTDDDERSALTKDNEKQKEGNIKCKAAWNIFTVFLFCFSVIQ